MKHYLIAIALIASLLPLALSCMQQDETEPITQSSRRIWRSISSPDLSDSSFANRFGYNVIVVSNRFRPRAISDTALGSISDDLMLHQGYSYKETFIDHFNKTLEGTSSSESSDWTPPQHNAPQPEVPQAQSSKLNRYKAIAMTKCIIS